jgi:CHAD domain-containing protein
LRRDILGLDPTDRAGADQVLAKAQEDREAAYGRLRTALRTPRCAALLEATARMAPDPPFKGRLARRPAVEVLPGLVRGPLRDLRLQARKQGNAPDDEALHRLRIGVKRLRYAAELVAPAAGRQAQLAARRLAKVQDVLGEHNDACVAGERLRGLGERTDATGAWAAGLLGGLELARAADCRARFKPLWTEASAARHWRWVS